ncbi:MAG TPA: circadian clock protein KaiA [Coleofasciculaceae cyanobacterium]
MRCLIAICTVCSSEPLVQSLREYLGADCNAKRTSRYTLTQLSSEAQFLEFLKKEDLHIDCFIFQESSTLQTLLEYLLQQQIFFPTIILRTDISQPVSATATTGELALKRFNYHLATLEIPVAQLNEIASAIDLAISQFIQLSPMSSSGGTVVSGSAESYGTAQSFKTQQMRLSKKLKERLGYLGVYYKRSPQNFLRHMSPPQQQELLHQLKVDYREIVLSYFSNETDLNQKIDNFANIAFFADVPVAQIVEIHMDLMDEFSKQLKLEGRSDDILQDYRLTLIDTIAHLCEMYRRSIPRES